jgi:hypothetical protein
MNRELCRLLLAWLFVTLQEAEMRRTRNDMAKPQKRVARRVRFADDVCITAADPDSPGAA